MDDTNEGDLSPRAASRTAVATAYLRAAHRLLDAPPLILDDSAALQLLGEHAAARIAQETERYRTPGMRALRAHVVLRSRYAEDRLAQALARRITQYVILGAGLDSFALRQPDWARGLHIFEVDQAATQAFKRSQLARAGLALPPNARFVQIDFERESLKDGLARQGVALDAPTFFSWLGVTMYLQAQAIDAALQSMTAFPRGSEVVLSFLQPPDAVNASGSAQLAERVAGMGEAFVSYFEPEALAAKLRALGFTELEFLTPQEAELRYFRARPRDLPPPRRTGLVSAIR